MPEGLDIYTDRKVYSVPEGLNELIYDISKEVLRCQPKNIYKFISEFLITLLKVREAVKVAVPIIEKEFETAESQNNFLVKYNLTKEQGDRFATIIQAAFRGYRVRKKLLHIADDYIADDMYDWDSISDVGGFRDPMFSQLRTRGVSRAESVQAATKIQAFYRGYKIRKIEQEKGVECLIHGVPSHESWRHDWLNEPVQKKAGLTQQYTWRKEFTDYHKNFTRTQGGDRLHIETIFAGKYEDYNLICDQASCQEFEVPTVAEAQDMAAPGELESMESEELDVEGAAIMTEMVKDRIKQTPISYEKADWEKMLFEKPADEKESVIVEADFLDGRNKAQINSVLHLPVREPSQPMITKSSKTIDTTSIVSTTKSDGSLKSSRKSESLKSKASLSVVSHVTPELSVKGLSEGGEGSMKEGSEKSVSHISTVSAYKEGSLNGESKLSTTTQNISEVSGENEINRVSKASSMLGSKTSLRTESKMPALDKSKTSLRTESKMPALDKSKTSLRTESKVSTLDKSKTSLRTETKIPSLDKSQTSTLFGSKNSQLTVSKASTHIGSKTSSYPGSISSTVVGSNPSQQTGSKASAVTGSKASWTRLTGDKASTSTLVGPKGSVNIEVEDNRPTSKTSVAKSTQE